MLNYEIEFYFRFALSIDNIDFGIQFQEIISNYLKMNLLNIQHLKCYNQGQVKI